MISVDRIEGTIAIVEVYGETIEIPVSALPDGTKEGAVLRFAHNENGMDTVGQENADRLERLRARDPGDMEIDI